MGVSGGRNSLNTVYTQVSIVEPQINDLEKGFVATGPVDAGDTVAVKATGWPVFTAPGRTVNDVVVAV